MWVAEDSVKMVKEQKDRIPAFNLNPERPYVTSIIYCGFALKHFHSCLDLSYLSQRNQLLAGFHLQDEAYLRSARS